MSFVNVTSALGESCANAETGNSDANTTPAARERNVFVIRPPSLLANWYSLLIVPVRSKDYSVTLSADSQSGDQLSGVYPSKTGDFGGSRGA